MMDRAMRTRLGREIPAGIPAADAVLEGSLGFPLHWPAGAVLFAHGSGSSRHSARNRFVAASLREAGFATLLLDLLTGAEEAAETPTSGLRFDIGFLAARLVAAIDWLSGNDMTRDLRLGCFGASTGAAAALVAAVERSDRVNAVVSRGGRPDLAADVLGLVRAPTLFIVGGNDLPVIPLNRAAYARLTVEKELVIVPGAGHLFEEPGTLEKVARLAGDWFARHLAAAEADGEARRRAH